MIEFILNNQDIQTDLPAGTTVLDFVRYRQNLKGTKIGCREGDCGACTILVGELRNGDVSYRSMTSCLMPLANAQSKHIVTIEGINPADGSLTPVQQAMLDESGTQCGFCTVGFVMSLTGFCLDDNASSEAAISSIDGNICRCTGYKSIERAAKALTGAQASLLATNPSHSKGANTLEFAINKSIVPAYFRDISTRLNKFSYRTEEPPKGGTPNYFVAGGTDIYVQKPDEIAESSAMHLFYYDELRGIRVNGDYIEIGASATVTDLLVSPIMQSIFPDLYKHLKLVSSTPIRNMATLAGNFVNASPIGDMTVWFLALDASILLANPLLDRRGAAALSGGVVEDVGNDAFAASVPPPRPSGSPPIQEGSLALREIALSDFYLGYKQLAKSEHEFIKTIRFKKPIGDFRFNFEKVCKRTYLDIATVNTAISLQLSDTGPPLPSLLQPEIETPKARIEIAHVSAGGVAPIPIYLRNTSEFLSGKEVDEQTIANAIVIMQDEISPISDVRGSADYKRLLLRQLFKAHFVELFETSIATENTEFAENVSDLFQ